MCQNHRNPINCILPSYILDKMNQNNNIIPRNEVELSKQASARFRIKRDSLQNMNKKTKARFMSIMADDNADDQNPKASVLIYDAGGLPILPGELIWKEGDSMPKDKDAKNVLKGSKATWDMYFQAFNRNSIDNLGMPLTQCIHYREDPRYPYINAFWDGEQMIYGDGDKVFFDSFTKDIDIIAHELSHGIIDYTANFEYKFESGALNESFADVFGMMVKHYNRNESVKKSDWKIGKNILIGPKYALRSMKAPGMGYLNHPEIGDDEQVPVMSQYKNWPENKDYGGVHVNSGIPNFAFYVAAFNLGGNSWEKMGKVWYAAMTDRKLLKKNSTFADARLATLKKAQTLYGMGSLVYKSVEQGWNEAEVL
jgi:Zn-dependent metalloprotease